MVNESAVVVFDDERAVANAGVMLPALLAQRLGLEQLIEECVDLGDRPGAANPGRKVMTMCSAMVLGADCIDDCDPLRSGQTAAVLGHRVAAPSTLGTFLRAFTFGHVRQLDRVLGLALERAWAAGAGPGDERLVIDVDSFVGEVHGYKKQGAGYGYTRQLGYHPLLATRADTGEVLHIRLRKGSANTSRGMLRFCEELIARVDRAGATGQKLMRTDSGFWAKKTFVRLDRAGWQFSIGIRMQPHVRALVDAIDEDAWVTLEDYPKTSVAQIAETTIGDFRMIIRRVRTLSQQGELLPSWEHYPFATNRTDDLQIVEAEHRQHAVVELAIRDLKDQALAHFPSGKYHANAAWTVIAALAHNLLRWTQKIALPDATTRTARTLRRRLLQVPGRLARSGRRTLLRMPARWPWRQDFLTALDLIRALPPPA
ncbi:IS1380 family transposase [Paraconexibacter antarcticus]|uniref:IS1380 family transposase n=1 Tax=Paraconexibacter antarcticus TaxID=2949664 RepID=A0ABY5DX19_9ACTN|nr:IS1380 family transposase [Paraconexibacter antarcticus]UTI66221.1 IS1380 family transposase [Paraconexibacter antarcticus]